MAVEFTFAHDTDKVFKLLCNADFLVDRCLALGEISADCTVEDDNQQIVVVLTREIERVLPPFLARLLDSRQTFEHVERWKQAKDTRHGSLLIRVSNQPVSVEAEMRLKPNPGGGCTYTVAHSVTANMPLIGRRVEGYLLTQMETNARAELEYLESALRR